jgi:hypothetical protein
VGKGKRVDVYLEVRKRRGHIFLNETSACAMNPNKKPTFRKPILFID